MRSVRTGAVASCALAAAIFLSTSVGYSQETEPCVGNSAPVTGPAAFGGLAIRMGAELAIEEINKQGGVLGQELRFIQYDDAGAPPRGVDNVRRIALQDNCIAMLGGYHSTVALAQRDPIHEVMMPYVGTIAANTEIIENGSDPNYMFRVSAKDRWVAQFLVEEAIERSATDKIGILYENTGWGKGALPDLQAALQEKGVTEVGAETFNWEDNDMTPQLIRLRDAGADAVLIWGLDREGNAILRSMQKIDWDPVKVAAWGLAGNLGELAGDLANCVLVMQTYSWMGELEPKAQKLYEKMQENYGLDSQADIRMGSGTANAYDAVHILAKAIEKAGSFDRQKVYEALFDVNHEGLVTNYEPAFERTEERHDSILPEAYKLTAWENGDLLPIEQTSCQ